MIRAAAMFNSSISARQSRRVADLTDGAISTTASLTRHGQTIGIVRGTVEGTAVDHVRIWYPCGKCRAGDLAMWRGPEASDQHRGDAEQGGEYRHQVSR